MQENVKDSITERKEICQKPRREMLVINVTFMMALQPPPKIYYNATMKLNLLGRDDLRERRYSHPYHILTSSNTCLNFLSFNRKYNPDFSSDGELVTFVDRRGQLRL